MMHSQVAFVLCINNYFTHFTYCLMEPSHFCINPMGIINIRWSRPMQVGVIFLDIQTKWGRGEEDSLISRHTFDLYPFQNALKAYSAVHWVLYFDACTTESQRSRSLSSYTLIMEQFYISMTLPFKPAPYTIAKFVNYVLNDQMKINNLVC